MCVVCVYVRCVRTRGVCGVCICEVCTHTWCVVCVCAHVCVFSGREQDGKQQNEKRKTLLLKLSTI